MTTIDIAGNLARTQDRIREAARAVGRFEDDVTLVVATKSVDSERTAAAVQAGALVLGESRVQEIVAKAPTLAALEEPPRIHLIGHLQSNKVNAALRHVSCIETVHSAELARAIGSRCEAAGRVMDVLIQVNVSGEPSKSGVDPAAAVDLALEVAAQPCIRLCGFMTIGANSLVEADVRAGYAQLRQIRDAVVGSGEPGTADALHLSMGMSRDLEWAIAEGATIVRVGSAILGTRPRP